MSLELLATVVVFTVLLISRTPVAFAILTAVATYFVMTPGPVIVFPQRVIASISTFPVLALPFFVLAGTAMARGGIAQRLLDLAEGMVGHFRGGLGQVNVLNSLFIGGMSGSAKADAAIDAKLLVPVMVRHGYSLGFSSALSAASGVLSPLLPPSIGLILYGLLAGVSVGRLFLAGILPALLVAAGLMIAVRIIAGRRGYGTVRESRLPLRAMGSRLKAAWLALLMPVGIIVGLRVGVFTPTELGALVAIYALLVGMFAYKEIRWRDLPSLLKEAALISASILIIIAAAGALGYVLTAERVPERLAALATSSFENPLVILLVINLLMLILGLFMESTSLLVIVTPVLAPVVIELGIDPVHFGVLLVFNLVIGGLTPPVGGNMYTVCAITGCPLDTFSREVLPFLGVLVAVLATITVVPLVTLFLPSLLMG